MQCGNMRISVPSRSVWDAGEMTSEAARGRSEACRIVFSPPRTKNKKTRALLWDVILLSPPSPSTSSLCTKTTPGDTSGETDREWEMETATETNNLSSQMTDYQLLYNRFEAGDTSDRYLLVPWKRKKDISLTVGLRGLRERFNTARQCW